MEIKISFLGAAQNVTGSCFLIQANGSKIVVDCGFYQERQFKDRNWNPFPFTPADVDAVLLTHAHLDHCGRLPKLVKEGFDGKIYTTAATAEIAKVILLDSAHIQEEDAEYKRKRHKREGRKGPHPELPLYNTEDAQKVLPMFSPVKYKEELQVADGITAAFYDAGHILGSSMIKLKISNGGEQRIILFSGDVGQGDRPIVREPATFEQADYILVESTYGNRIHKGDEEDIKAQLIEVINSTMEKGGNLIIPSFALERAQEVLYYFNELLLEEKIPHLLVFLDSPMASKITEIFKHHPELFDDETVELLKKHESPFSFPGLKMTGSTDESKAINFINGPIVVIAGSGMCTGGRVKHHLVNNITNPNSTVMFVGYQANATLGRSIVDGAKKVRILGEKYPVAARIVRINGFSAHADSGELSKWLSALKSPPKQVFVVHGEAESAKEFAGLVRKKTGWNVTIPEYQDEITLD